MVPTGLLWISCTEYCRWPCQSHAPSSILFAGCPLWGFIGHLPAPEVPFLLAEWKNVSRSSKILIAEFYPCHFNFHLILVHGWQFFGEILHLVIDFSWPFKSQLLKVSDNSTVWITCGSVSIIEIFFGLCWVFVAACRLSLVVARRGYSLAVVHRLLTAATSLIAEHGL